MVIQVNFIPFYLSISLLSNMINNILLFNNSIMMKKFYLSLFTTVVLILIWIYTLLMESLLGYQTKNLHNSLMFAYLLFILSEVMFFFSFFWAYFDSALLPSIEMGLVWPPVGITPLDMYHFPLLNTIILLSSGLSITWAHDALLHNYFNDAVSSLATTIWYGWWFLVYQYTEYYEASFDISSGIYGSVFFMTTGFHGLHVFLGSMMLLYCLLIMLNYYYLYNSHISFELSAWYWHFVDVVWLFLYVFVYSWGQ